MTDLEKKIVGRLTNLEEVKQMWDKGLRESVFVDDGNRAVFTWTIEYWLTSQMQMVPTEEVLRYEFGDRYEPEIEAPGEETLTAWVVERLQDRYASNGLQTAMREAAVESRVDPKGAADKLWRKTQEISAFVAPRYNRADISETTDEMWQRYLDRQQEQVNRGMTYGLREVDVHTGGILPGEVAAVAGFAKTGKSFFLAHAAVRARQAGFKPIFFTLEQGIPEMTDRIHALWSGVSYHRLTHGSLTEQEQGILRQHHEQIREFGSFPIEKPERGERTVKHLVSRARSLDCDYLIIDQLSFMDSVAKYRSATEKHAEIIFDLKDEINNEQQGRMPCLLAVQFNRASTKDKGGMLMERLANSSAIEQTVDIALGLSRTRELRANHAMRCDIMGSRRSDTASWLLEWRLGDRSHIGVREVIE